MIRRRYVLAALASAALIPSFAPHALAQDYPNRPITVIVPWPAGGSSDIAMRAICDVAGKILGQTMVVDNKPGASGTLGPATMVSGAKPD